MDVSTFRAGDPDRPARAGRSRSAAIAYAGVGPTARRLPRTEAFLAGRPFSEATFREAGRLARAEVEPISDVRGSRDFRLRLAENILLKFYQARAPTRSHGEPAHAGYGRAPEPATTSRRRSGRTDRSPEPSPSGPGPRRSSPSPRGRRSAGRSPTNRPGARHRPGGLPRRHPARPRRAAGGVRRQHDGPRADRRDRRLRGREGRRGSRACSPRPTCPATTGSARSSTTRRCSPSASAITSASRSS